MSEQFESFEYVTLADIDPTDKPVPRDMYALMLMKIVLETYEPKSGPNAGQKKQRISARLAITGDSPFAGRQLFHRFYLNTFSLRDLRKLAEVTGVSLTQPVDAIVAELQSVQPSFKVLVDNVQSRDFTQAKGEDGKFPLAFDPTTGAPVMENVIVWRNAVPMA